MCQNVSLKRSLPIIKVSFQRTKNEDFYRHYFIGVLTYVLISRSFIWKSIIWKLSSERTITLWIVLIRALIHFFTTWIQIKFLSRIEKGCFCKAIFLWKHQIWKKLQKLFTDKLRSSNLKIILASPVRVKIFFTFIDLLLYCSGSNFTYYGIRLNVTLKSKFVNI